MIEMIRVDSCDGTPSLDSAISIVYTYGTSYLVEIKRLLDHKLGGFFEILVMLKPAIYTGLTKVKWIFFSS